MSDALKSETGGLTALVIENRPGGAIFLKPVVTEIVGEPPYPRRAGMGGVRYLRHCLESAAIDRSGRWPAGMIQRALELLQRIDGASGWTVEAEIRSYRALSETEVVPAGRREWIADPGMAFVEDTLPDEPRDYAAILQELAALARSDLSNDAFIHLWHDLPEQELKAWRAGRGDTGRVLTALLGRQAWLERRFLVAVAGDEPDDAWPLFHEMVSVRYVRTLCLLHRAAATSWREPLLWPDITELGRSALLLCCCGWLDEAHEILHRSSTMLRSAQNRFVPLMSWFGSAFGRQSPEMLAKAPVEKFDEAGYAAAQRILAGWRTPDPTGLAADLASFAARRSWRLGQFDDEYHLDFDDGLSWALPYEAGAVIVARAKLGLATQRPDHPLFDLPTARFQPADGPIRHYQDIYARFIAEIGPASR